MAALNIEDIARFKELIPESREPYIATRIALNVCDRDSQKYAIARLFTANSNGTLQPPLSEDLAGAVGEIHEAFADEPTADCTLVAARVVLGAVFEHGYRSDRG